MSCNTWKSSASGSQKGGVGSPETEVTDVTELSCGFWDPDSGTMEKHQVLITNETSLKLLSNVLCRLSKGKNSAAKSKNNVISETQTRSPHFPSSMST